jgi:GDPmannose 4,6-dehydratase
VHIRLGLAKDLHLGNLESRRDGGFAEDYIDAKWRMIQNDQPVDFVVGTVETHTVGEFCETFSHTSTWIITTSSRIRDLFAQRRSTY